MLQLGRSLVRFPMVSLEFFIDIKSFRSRCGPGVDSASNRNEYREYFLGVKSGRCVRLTTLPPSCATSMACSLPRLKSLTCLSEVYCLCYSSQRRPGLETADTEWIVGDSFEAWNFPASRPITFQTRNVCVEAEGGHLSIFCHR